MTDAEAERAIRVLFTVPAHREIEIAMLSGSSSVMLAEGEYALTFRHGRSSDQSMWATLAFEAVAEPVTAELLRADTALTRLQRF